MLGDLSARATQPATSQSRRRSVACAKEAGTVPGSRGSQAAPAAPRLLPAPHATRSSPKKHNSIIMEAARPSKRARRTKALSQRRVLSPGASRARESTRPTRRLPQALELWLRSRGIEQEEAVREACLYASVARAEIEQTSGRNHGVAAPPRVPRGSRRRAPRGSPRRARSPALGISTRHPAAGPRPPRVFFRAARRPRRRRRGDRERQSTEQTGPPSRSSRRRRPRT